MLNRLYRTDMERLVLSYEIIRNALQREIDRRLHSDSSTQACNKPLIQQNQLPTKFALKTTNSGGVSSSASSISASVIPVEAAVPFTAPASSMSVVKSYSQPIQANPYHVSTQPTPPPPAGFANGPPSSIGPIKSASSSGGALSSSGNSVPSLSSIHSILPGSNSGSKVNALDHNQSTQSISTNGSTHQLPLGKTVSSTSMTSGHGSILESSSSTSSLFSLSMSGSHPYLATSNSSIHSMTSSSSSLAQQQAAQQLGQSQQYHLQAPGGVTSGPSFASISHLFSAEEETKV